MDYTILLKPFVDWRAAIDILLMSAGLFFLYRTLQRLGTGRIAAGVLVAMVVYLLASVLDLKGIEWIFDNLSQVAVIALIISQGKCERFGARLPISQSARLPEEYGTRHYAGMGLAERSDALVIVVSEERGTLTIFQNGNMKPILDRADLIKAIARHWQALASLAPRIPEGLARRHVLAQIGVSLGLAALFWTTLVITQGEILQKAVTVPVEFTSAPPHLVLVGEKDRTVQLHLSGSKSDLDDLKPADLRVKLDLSKAVAGKQVFGLTGDTLRLPRNVSLLEIVPTGIALQLAEIEEQEVSIQPQLIGKLPGKLKLLKMEITPATVRVRSPRIDRQPKPITIITTPVYLESIAGDTRIFCKVIAPSAVQPVDGSWPNVEVAIKVAN